MFYNRHLECMVAHFLSIIGPNGLVRRKEWVGGEISE